jgi:hypothetical protein
MSLSVEIRFLRFTPRTWPLPVLATLVIVASALPRLFDAVVRYASESNAEDAGVAAIIALAYAMPALLLAPFAVWPLLLRRVRRVDRVAAGALLAAYALWGVPALVHATVFAADTYRSLAEFDALVGPARRAVRADPVLAAREAAAAGETGFLFVADDPSSPLESSCVRARFGVRAIRATADVPLLPGQQRFRRRAIEFARRYNAEMAAAVGVSPADLWRPGDCAERRPLGYWPVEAEGLSP